MVSFSVICRRNAPKNCLNPVRLPNMPLDFAPYLDDWKSDPFPIYREMRDESPVYFSSHSSSEIRSMRPSVVRMKK